MLPDNFNFARDVIDKQAGERAGLLFVDAYGHRRDYTFAEISDQSQRYAAALRALGVAQGERVLLCNGNTAKCAFVMLALARLGAVAVPCPEDLTAAQILERAQRTSAATVISDRKRRPVIEGLQDRLAESTRYVLIGETVERWARLDTLTENAKPYPGIATKSADMAFVFDDDDVFDYGALYEARNFARRVLEPAQSDRVWSTFPMGSRLWHTFLQAPWWYGAASIVHEGAFDPRERLDLVRELEVTILCQSPQEYRAQLQLPDVERFRLPRLRRTVSLGEELDAATARRWEERFGIPLIDAGGAADLPEPEDPLVDTRL